MLMRVSFVLIFENCWALNNSDISSNNACMEFLNLSMKP